MAIKVVLHRLLVRRDKPVDTDAVKTKEAFSSSGLVIPEFIKKGLEDKEGRENASMDKGVVVGIGPTAFRDYGVEVPVNVGDYICYAKFGGKDVTDPETNEVFVVINDEDLVAILTKKEPLDG